MDGTFCTTLPNFEQVFIIQPIVHGTCIPVMCALRPDGKAITYVYLFYILFATAKRCAGEMSKVKCRKQKK
ncbi:unnamed protein product [Rotaria magnacalcarata]|uniref:Uncharacterized protein n=1 Tax=Rotaria magnacalcarata TaxID=392030 RepID=A0A820CEK9_9BILA|nr:unnamed protein product [Rotaria magnacalcarata]